MFFSQSGLPNLVKAIYLNQLPPELVYLDSVRLTEFYLAFLHLEKSYSLSEWVILPHRYYFAIFSIWRRYHLPHRLSLGDNISLFSIWRNPIFLSVPKTGDGIFINVAAGMMLVFYVLYGVDCLFPVCYILCVAYDVRTIYCVLIMFYTLYIV